jgi:hypothetical protein
MRFWAIIGLTLMLGACSTIVPVTQKFPDVPEEYLKPADKLTPLAVTKGKPQLSDLLDNVNENYGKYYELRDKYNGWIEWYNTQKKIHDDVK